MQRYNIQKTSTININNHNNKRKICKLNHSFYMYAHAHVN